MFLLAALAAAVAGTAQAGEVKVDIACDLPARSLHQDVYGYSIEPTAVEDFISTRKMFNLLSAIANVTGTPPRIRIGGNTADQTYQHATLPDGRNSTVTPGSANGDVLRVTPAWYSAWADYFPPGTQMIYTLNLANTDGAWANAQAQAEAAHGALGSKLAALELGNEIDHFVSKKWRGSSWGVAEYMAQFRNITGAMREAAWYQAAQPAPTIQAGVFADPPWHPDQHVDRDDFSIENLTARVTAEDGRVISSYAVHMYVQSTCDAARLSRLRLDLLSDHAVLWHNVSQYSAQVAAAERAGAPLVLGETNSVSCGGRSGISDTFGAALWGVDYVLTAAALGLERVFFHLGNQSEYSSFTPLPYTYKGEALEDGIRAGWYGHYFVARAVVAPAAADGENAEKLTIAALPSANSSQLSGFAVYSASSQLLRKLVFLNMAVWNGTSGLSNPSTLKVTDSTSSSPGLRPNTTLVVSTPWTENQTVAVTRLSGPGTNAKSEVTVSGVTFDSKSGEPGGTPTSEELQVGAGGVLSVTLDQAEAALLEVRGDSSGACPRART